MTVHIENLGGNCPVQGYGNVEGRAFYFRARGSIWSIELQNGNESDVVMSCRYGPRYSAGWMKDAEARAIIEAAAPMLVSLLALPNRRGEPERPSVFGPQSDAINARLDETMAAIVRDTRARAEILADNAALRARVAELEAERDLSHIDPLAGVVFPAPQPHGTIDNIG